MPNKKYGGGGKSNRGNAAHGKEKEIDIDKELRRHRREVAKERKRRERQTPNPGIEEQLKRQRLAEAAR